MCKTPEGKLKVSIAESILSKANGTTSATGFCGMSLVLIGIFMFIILIGFYFFNIGEAANIKDFLDIDLIVISIGSTLIGGRKIIGMIGNNKNVNIVKAVSDAMDEYKKENNAAGQIQHLND